MSNLPRIIVTGPRDFADRALVRLTLDNLLDEYGLFILVHGDCETGADATAAWWAAFNDVPTEPYPADWQQYGRAAGPIRNSWMVKMGADLCVTFVPPGGLTQGTGDCLRKAEKAGIPVQQIISTYVAPVVVMKQRVGL